VIAVAGELLAADVVTAPGRSLQLADVIYSRNSRPLNWLYTILDRYPGCAVVAAGSRDGGYLVAARAGHWRVRLGAGTDEPGLGALLSGAFVHTWLAAGCVKAPRDRVGLGRVDGRVNGQSRGQLLALLAWPIHRPQRVGECQMNACLLIASPKSLHDRERFAEDAFRLLRLAGLQVGLSQARQAACLVVGIGQSGGHVPRAE
jgi:hypothetical protein